MTKLTLIGYNKGDPSVGIFSTNAKLTIEIEGDAPMEEDDTKFWKQSLNDWLDGAVVKTEAEWNDEIRAEEEHHLEIHLENLLTEKKEQELIKELKQLILPPKNHKR